MKILITTDVYAPTVNGVVTSILNLEKELSLRGHEVKILTLSQKGHSYQEGRVSYIRSYDAGRVYPGARVAVLPGHRYIRELVEWKPDVVHSQCEFTSLYYAKKIAKASKAALLHTYHTIYEDYTHYFSPNEAMGKRAAAFLTRRLLKSVDGLIAPTEKVEKLLNGYGLKKETYVLPTGIDLEPFTEAAEEKAAFGRRLGKAPVLITVGRVAKEKNLEEILRLLAQPRGKRYQWLVVGDGPYRTELQRLAEELGVADRVTFAGMVPREQVAGYYQMGDVFVSASQSETQGLTYGEALASGLPAVCRKDDCLKGVVINGYNGWQYETEEAFFDACEELFPLGLERYGKVTGWQYEMCSVNARNSAWKLSTAAFGLGAEKIYRRYLKEETEKATHPLWGALHIKLGKTS